MTSCEKCGSLTGTAETYRFCGPCTRRLIAGGMCKICSENVQHLGTGNRCAKCAALCTEKLEIGTLTRRQLDLLEAAGNLERIQMEALVGNLDALAKLADGEIGDLAATVAVVGITDDASALRVAKVLTS